MNPLATERPPRATARPARRARWCRGTRLLVAATALWAAFLALHVLLAGNWWPWLVVETMPPPALVAVPVLLLALTPLARPVRRPLGAALLALLLAGAPLAGVGPGAFTGSVTGGTGTGTGTVKVFSWNTDYWHMSDDPDAFYAYLRDQRADIYLLQEYLYWKDGKPVRVDDLDRLRAAFPGYHVAAESELVTLSRLPVTATRLLDGADTDWRGSRILRTDIRIGAEVVSFYNIHLAVPIDLERTPFSAGFLRFTREQHQRRQAELGALRADLARNPLPALAAGDFNSAWVPHLLRLEDGLERRDPQGAPTAWSWPASGLALPRMWRLDWLFSTDDVRVTGYRFRDGHGFSDHMAQDIRISIQT
ncbi:endonuclease/exonuclease/phosphatase family protein [Streptomyces sp. SP18CS02]|uniref:endonuclease/exonuclease/phosphatase family protein n=1 Tax=Streptomyces sp. SP18CS02 TaxID=3002531 RepID=UPI002E785781|nr:endonuclease/exonuclease/phosphatase family protein [Streptomyces sp. SP18CS02]MEE1753774.1 endonuclease/exonuclease/phosphatase family protein [Streptomyces sp. SP18CS02]